MSARDSLSMLVIALSLAGPARGGTNITVDEYTQAVEELALEASAGGSAAARAAAEVLLSARVMTPLGNVATDAWAIEPVRKAADSADLARSVPSLTALAASLRQGVGGGRPPDAALLDEVTAAHAQAARREGGSLLIDDLVLPTLTEKAKAALRELGEGLLELLGDLARWLTNLVSDRDEGPRSMTSLVVVVGTVVLVALTTMLLLGLSALRRKREPEPALPEPSPRDLAADVDPLARTVSGWERRAAELAAAGRTREAVRAWYNGVLATLHVTGILHHRRDRTNWDYVALLGPDLPWRPTFRELTTLFDREWYGLNATTPEALGAFERRARSVIDAARRGRS